MWNKKQSEVSNEEILQKAICKNCFQPLGKHAFVGESCMEGDWWSATKRFEIFISEPEV